jgi:hypothetical protein
MADKFRYHQFLQTVANEDVQFLIPRDIQYGASWKASGGRSAWFNLARKIDRLKELMRTPTPPPYFNFKNVQDTIDAITKGEMLPGSLEATAAIFTHLMNCYASEDVFQKIEADMSGRDGSVLAEIRDLRRYLLLVEAEIVSRIPREIEDTSLHALQND